MVKNAKDLSAGVGFILVLGYILTMLAFLSGGNVQLGTRESLLILGFLFTGFAGALALPAWIISEKKADKLRNELRLRVKDAHRAGLNVSKMMSVLVAPDFLLHHVYNYIREPKSAANYKNFWRAAAVMALGLRVMEKENLMTDRMALFDRLQKALEQKGEISAAGLKAEADLSSAHRLLRGYETPVDLRRAYVALQDTALANVFDEIELMK